MPRATTAHGASVDDFLNGLPAGRREAMSRVRDVVRTRLPAGYEEVLSKGTIVYQVPFARYADTYNGQPLWYAALAPQKNYMALYLMSAYGSTVLAARLRAGFEAAGKKLDMGKSCIRFRTADDLALDAIGDVVAAVPVDKWVQIAQAARQRPARKRPARKSPSRKRPAR